MLGVFKTMRMIYFNLLILISCTFAAFAENNSKNVFDSKLVSFLQNKQHEKVGKYLSRSHMSLDELENLAIQTHSIELLHAVRATRAIAKLDDVDLSKGELLQLSWRIETKVPSTLATNKFLSAKRTKLGSSIDYDATTGLRFLALDKGDNDVIGEGSKKVVTKAVLYDTKNPKIVARCQQMIDISLEEDITKRVQGPGIIKAYAFTEHREGRTVYKTMYGKLYRDASLHKFFDTNKVRKLDLKDKVEIAYDLLSGLEKLRENNVIHRDMCASNCLIDITKVHGVKKIDAVVADLGSARYIWDIDGMPPDGHSAYTGPEGIFKSKMSGRQYYKTDVYALGTVLYWLYYEKTPAWVDENMTKTPYSKNARYHKYVSLLKHETRSHRQSLSRKIARGKALSPDDQFEWMILRMLSIDPDARGTASELKVEAQAILNRL
jgi:serine/threonine protein kinase